MKGLDAGGVHVDKELIAHLWTELVPAFEIQTQDDKDFVRELVDEGLDDFQKSGKRNFSYLANILPVRIGVRGLNVPSIEVKKGIMNITG